MATVRHARRTTESASTSWGVDIIDALSSIAAGTKDWRHGEDHRMHDIIIRGGTVVDGTGTPGFRADIAVANGRIVAIGDVGGEAREVIDAAGAIVTPGFIDIHTHYDGQFVWDDMMEPSFSNGVTTAIGGNCGVGFAPVRPGDEQDLIDIMEGVEDIPGIVIQEGLDWAWATFPDYLDRLDDKQFALDVAVHLAHAPMRIYVMGDRGKRDEPATPEDVARMQEIVREAMAAGAVGVSIARIEEHRTIDNRGIPGTYARDIEFEALASAMAESGRGVFQIVPLGAAGSVWAPGPTTEQRMEEHARIVRFADAANGRPTTYLLHAFDHAPEEWRMMLDATKKARADGLDVRAQVGSRGICTTFSLDGYHIFSARPSYRAIAHLPRAERAAAMRDPARRAAILSEDNSATDGIDQRTLRMLAPIERFLPRCFVLDDTLDYEPAVEKRLDHIAAGTGRSATEVFYDILSDGDGASMVVDFNLNYTGGNLDAAYAMLGDGEAVVTGLSDAGAHLKVVCDGAAPSFLLWFWARDRKRGPTLPLEHMVWRLTGNPAELYGLVDRGEIKLGMRADINVIDFARLGNEAPHIDFDLPEGGARLMQRGTGYRATMVNGVVTRRDDQDTGARPGRLVRGSRLSAPTAAARELA
jgi:N-acyl-D-amino-acid deacylase